MNKLYAEEVKEAEVLAWYNSNKKNLHILPGLLDYYLLFYLKSNFQKMITCKNKTGICWFQKLTKFLIFIYNFKVQEEVFFGLMTLTWVNVKN